MLNDFVGQKGDEMTEVVNSIAASQQLDLLAPRQQAFAVERNGIDAGFATADTAPVNVEPQTDNLPQFNTSSDDQNPVNRHQEQAPTPQPRPEPVSGPSKARIEIKHIDLGLTPSEVVGTPDILQRFDTNGDGRVDLIEAARAGVAREGVFTFAGIGGAKETDDVVQTVVADAPTAQSADAPTPVVPGTPEAVAAPASEKKLFRPADLEGTKKVHAAAVAANGGATGVVDAPKKFYGQGVEAVVGKFAAEVQPKVVAKADTRTTTTVSEDGSGEVKIYDKVAQTDADQSSPDTTDKHPNPEAAKQAAQIAAYTEAAAVLKAAIQKASGTAVTA